MFFLVFSLISGVFANTGLNHASEEKLISRLLSRYDPKYRPIADEADVLHVNISVIYLTLLVVVSLFKIEKPMKNFRCDLSVSVNVRSSLAELQTWSPNNHYFKDQAQETIMFSGEFLMEWYDTVLKWDRDKEAGQEWLKMKESAIWTPDITVSTSIKTEAILTPEQRLVDVRYDGLVRASLFGVVTNLCSMKVDKFPYDSQTCKIDIGPWSYTSEQVFVTAGNATNTEIDGNSEWDVLNITSARFDQFDADVNFSYTNVRFNLVLKRRPLFYLWVLLIPTFIVTTVCICGLFTPTNSLGDREEKVNLGMSTLLSSAVILQIIANSMPKTSSLPLLGNFILAEIFVVAIGVVFSVFLLVLHHRANTREWNPPKWITAFLSYTGSHKFVRKYIKSKMEAEKNETKMTTVYTGPNAHLFAEVENTLQEVTDFLSDEDEDRIRELVWIKFFDRIDCSLLLFFQLANALLTFLICRH